MTNLICSYCGADIDGEPEWEDGEPFCSDDCAWAHIEEY